MVKAIVGANWGDEGKGKITDTLAKESDIIVRFQGGANAGHTIVNNYGKFALHTLPSGVFYGHTTSIIGNGVALDIPKLIHELDDVVVRVYRSRRFWFPTVHRSLCHIMFCLIHTRKQDWPVNHSVLPSPVLHRSIQINMRRSVFR